MKENHSKNSGYKTIRILHLVLTDKWGGGAVQIENLCKELTEFGQTECSLLTIKNGEIHKKISQDHLDLHAVPMAFNADPRAIIKLISICENKNIDLIHIHGSTALTIAVMAQKFKKLPPFVFSKKTSFPIKKRRSTLYKYNHPNLMKIFCVSEETKRISQESITDHSKLVRIYHGTDIKNKSSETPFLLREKLNLDKGKILIGTIANHIKAKNLESWINLIHEIVNIRGIKTFHFVEIGSFSALTVSLKERISELKLEKYISLMGFLPNASNFIGQFDISLLTSKSEGIPQFIYESFYFKVPVVSTNVGGIPEIIDDGVNGMLSNPYEVQSLADKLIALSNDKVLMEKFSELSYQKLIANFTTKKMAEQTLAEYKKVLYGKNGTGN